MGSPVYSLVEVRIIIDDVGALSAELKSDVLEVALRCCLHDLATDECRARERHLLDLHMRRDCVTGCVPVASEDVDDTRGEAGLIDKVAHLDGCQGCEFGGF